MLTFIKRIYRTWCVRNNLLWSNCSRKTERKLPQRM